MIRTTLQQAAAWCGAIRLLPDAAAGKLPLAGVSTDTRTLAAGQLFVPIVGARDGHEFLAAAEAAGAAAALWQADRPLPETKLPLLIVDDTLAALQRLAAAYAAALGARVVGVTGSNGKTTTKDLIAAVLATGFRVAKTEGSFNNHIGLPLTILRAPEQTEVLVLEMGMSDRGEIALLTRLAPPDIAVITNIGESHLLQLGSRRNIARAKLEIAEGLKAGGTLVYNGDEPLLSEELAALPLPEGAATRTFGRGEGCDLRLGRVELTPEGSRFQAADDPNVVYELPILGRHNAMNGLAAVAVGRLFGLPAERIAAGLRSAKVSGMRIEKTSAWNGALVLNDAFNASPTSVHAAIELLGGLPSRGGKRYLVLGDMLALGPDEALFHAEVGRRITPEAADALLAYGPLSASIVREAEKALPPGQALHFADKQALIAELLARLGPDDLVLVKASRGMKLEEVVHALQKGAVS